MKELLLKNKTLIKLRQNNRKNEHKLTEDIEKIKIALITNKLKDLNIKVGDKVMDSKNKNVAYLESVKIRQTLFSYTKNVEDLNEDDFEYRTSYNNVLKDGSRGKRDFLGILKLDNLIAVNNPVERKL